MLELALQRIKVPERTIGFIINLFKSRKFRVITGVGLSEAITVEDGIDQGEVISPLAWRIFYDPLLVRVQKEKNLGYIVEV